MKKAVILFFAFALFVFVTGTVVVSDVPMFSGILVATAYAADPATNAAPIVAETLFEDGTTNTWTQTDLTDALGLMNRKYHRDIETESGRTKWHGKRMGQYLIDGEDGKQCLVQLYEDGFAWTNAAKRVSLKDPEAAAQAKAAAEARQAEWERAHLPPEVAALLAARRAAAKTNEVTIVVRQ